MIHLDYRDARPIYAQIVDRFREQIGAGVLTPGEKLPSVRELAVQLSINPNTIQRAYRQLEMEGWITTMPGKGCFVCGVPLTAAMELTKYWDELHRAVSALLRCGVTRDEITARIQKEGNDHA